jgi:hypothetical protein
VFWYWLCVGPALLLVALSLRGEGARTRYVARRLAAPPPDPLPPATVIVPVKGGDHGLRENLAALANLDYPDYELIVAAHSAFDIPPGVLPARVRVVLAHGEDPNTGEKVQNLQEAVRAASRTTQVLAFADSDGRPTPGWLRALVTPLGEEGVGAATGFRWFAPEAAGFWSLLRSVWDAVAMGRLGPGDNPFVWGGAMAVRKEVFTQARVAEHWKNTVSDDYALAHAVHAAGLGIAFAPGALTPSHGGTGGRELLSWARRQMMITRRHRPGLWLVALASHILYCGAMAASAVLACRGHAAAMWALPAQLLPGMWKGLRRAQLARAALPECESWFRRCLWIHALLVPLATWLWLIALVSSGFGTTIHWRGRSYDLWRATGR